MLLIVLLPSATTCGKASKLSFNKTSWETLRAASEPLAIEIAQSLFFKANTSFTPSPVMATVLPLSCKISIIHFFCFGVTLPKTSYFWTTFSNSSLFKLPMSIPETFFNPTFFAIFKTVETLSPEMILTITPWDVK